MEELKKGDNRKNDLTNSLVSFLILLGKGIPEYGSIQIKFQNKQVSLISFTSHETMH